MAKIGISADFLKPGKVGGAEYFFKNLVLAMDSSLPKKDTLTIFIRPNVISGLKHIKVLNSKWSAKSRFIQELLFYIWYGKKFDVIIFSNYYTPLWVKKSKIITIIYDAQYKHLPFNFSLLKRFWLNISHRLTLMMADKVVVISNFVKTDLIKLYGNYSSSKIEVVYLPISWDRFSCIDKNMSLPKRYILSVAAQYSHKNLVTLIKAYNKVRINFPDVKLILAGQFAKNLVGVVNTIDLNQIVNDLNLQTDVIFTGHISDEELGRLYQDADVFVFPSLFEGFGMPPVEALGFGLPVITTKCASLPEVTLGMAIYLENPLDIEEMSNCIMKILSNPTIYRKSEEQIRIIKNTYSPATIAQKYLEICNAK